MSSGRTELKVAVHFLEWQEKHLERTGSREIVYQPAVACLEALCKVAAMIIQYKWMSNGRVYGKIHGDCSFHTFASLEGQLQAVK